MEQSFSTSQLRRSQLLLNSPSLQTKSEPLPARRGFLNIRRPTGLWNCWAAQARRAYLAAGRIDEATSYAREALALRRRFGGRGIGVRALSLTADIAAASGAENAEDYYREALALAERRGMRPQVAHCHFGLGKLHRCRGDREQAQEHLTTAMAMYREMGMTYWLEQAKGELRQLG